MIELVLHAAVGASHYFYNSTYFWLYGFYLFGFLLHKTTKPFQKGFLWGLVFISLHSFSLLYVVIAQTGLLWACFAPLTFYLYFALCTALLFLLCSYCLLSKMTCLFIIPALFVGYYYFLESACFWFLGLQEGYPFISPLITLVNHPLIQWASVYINQWVIVYLLIVVQLFLFYTKHKQFFIAFYIFILVGSYYAIHPLQTVAVEKEPESLCFIPLHNKQGAYLQAEYLYTTMLKQKTPHTKFFILPESSYPFPLGQNSLALKIWQNYLLDYGQIIIGAHRKSGQKLFNTMFLIDKCRIIHSYDKSHLVPFFEYIPDVVKGFRCFSFFLNNRSSFSCGDINQNCYFTLDNTDYIPTICSELFYKKRKGCKHPLLCIINDSYFGLSQFQRVMLHAAQRVSIVEQRTILYCTSFLLCSITYSYIKSEHHKTKTNFYS